jgi:hypothetical protein
LYCDGLPRVEIPFSEFKNPKQILLVDSGCTGCLIKLGSVQNTKQIVQSNVKLKRIGGQIEILGTLQVFWLGKSITFRIVKELPIDVDGFLGSEFFKIFNAIIDYEQNKFFVNNGYIQVVFPMFIDENCSFVLNERCESFQKISTQETEDCVIESHEIAEGVFIASSIVTPKNGSLLIKFLNTRNEKVKINNFKPILTPVKNFEICNFSKNPINSNRVENLLKILNLETLNTEEKNSVTSISSKFADVFHMEGDSYSHTNLYEQSIRLKPNEVPVYKKPYRIPQSQKVEIERQVNDMLEKKIIEQATSEWSSPILLVPKKADQNGHKKWRLVIDYRGLNEKIQNEKFPLANISDILDSLSGAIYFTTLDLSQGFYQLKIKEEDRPCTAFVTDKGQYQMCKLPMGLKISPSAFSRLMTIAMAGLNYENCFVYLDDLIVFGKNMEQHNKNLIVVMERLRKVMVHTNATNFTTNSFTSLQTRILAQKNRQRIRPF